MQFITFPALCFDILDINDSNQQSSFEQLLGFGGGDGKSQRLARFYTASVYQKWWLPTEGWYPQNSRSGNHLFWGLKYFCYDFRSWRLKFIRLSP